MFGMSRMWLAVTQAINEIVDTRVLYTYEDYVKSLYPVAYWRLGEVNGVSQATDFTGEDGSKLDNRLWRVDQSDPDVNASDISIQSNSLLMEITSGTLSTVNSITAASRNYLTGDFDIQIDISNFSSSSTSGSCYFWLVVSDGTKSRWAAIRQYNGTTKQWATSVTGSNSYYTRTANYGRLRLVRTGSSLSSYYADGVGSFVLMKTESAFGASPVNVSMSIYDNSTAGSINPTANWDNLTITTDGWIPKYAVDEIGNHDGTYVNSPTVGVTGLVTDDINTAVTLNGTNEYITASDTGLPLGTSAATFSFLMKSTDATTLAIFEYGTNAAGQKMSVYVSSTGGVAVTLHSSNIYYSANVLNGNTHIVTVVLPANGTLNDVSIYVDGTLLTSVESSVSPTTAYNSVSGGTIYIGRNISNTTFFDGTLDEIQILNYALTSQQVQNLYLLSIGLHVDKPLYLDYAQNMNPIGYWRLGESSGTIAYDISGNNHHGDYVNSPTLGSTGLLVDDNDTAVAFNGTTQYVLLPSGIATPISNTFTVSAIINSDTTAFQKVFVFNNDGIFTRIQINPTADKIQFYCHGTTTEANLSVDFYNKTGIHHLVLTAVDGGVLTAYIDGINVGTASVSGFADLGTQLNNVIGVSRVLNDRYFDGIIDEVKIFDYVLTSQQIQDLYLLSEGVSLTPTSYYDTVRSLMPVSYWRLGESAGTTAVDEIGSYNGTYVNTPTLGATGLLTNDDDTSVTFNGTDEYITIGDYFNFDISDPFSVMFSIKLSALNKEHYIVGNRDSASIYQGWQVMINSSNEFRLLIDSTNVTVRYDSGITAQINTVYHISMTYDGSGNSSGMHIYINGADDVSGTYSGSGLTGSIVSAADTRIGARDDLSAITFLQGTLDEPTLFNYVLTAQQAKDLYLLSEGVSLTPTSYNDIVRNLMPIAYYKLDETGAATTAVDEIGNHDGTYVSAPNLDSAGLLPNELGTSINIDGTNDNGYISLPNMTTIQSVVGLAAMRDTTNNQDLFTQHTGTGDNRLLLQLYQNGTFPRINVYVVTNGNYDVRILSDQDMVLGKTYHIALVYDGSDTYLYIDGVQQTTVLTGVNCFKYNSSTKADIIGGRWATGDVISVDGDRDIDEVAFFDYGLSATEITNLYNASRRIALTLTIDSSLVDEDLYDFPMLINIDTDSGIGDYDSTNLFKSLDDGLGVTEIQKLQVTYPAQLSRDQEQCKVEIDRWDSTNEQAQLWVKVPYISKDTDTVLQLIADPSNTSNASNIGYTGDAAAQAVWTEYDAVYHMSADGAESVSGLDGTLNGIDGTNVVDFGIGKGLSFNGTNEWISLPDLAHGSAGVMTIEIEAQTTDLLTIYQAYGLNKAANTNDPLTFLRLNNGGSSNEIRYLADHVTTDQIIKEASGLTMTDANTYVQLSTENGDMSYAANGIIDATVSTGSGGYASIDTVGQKNNHIGGSRVDSPTLLFKGNLKEFRFSKSIKTDGWIAANYESTQDTLITYTVEE